MEKNAQTKVMMKTLRGWPGRPEQQADRIRPPALALPCSPRTRFSAKTAGRGSAHGPATNWTARAASSASAVDYPAGRLPRHRLLWFELPGVGYDSKRGVVTNVGRVVDENGELFPACATGWIKRPRGLIGSTRSDALETITHLLEDRENLPTALSRTPRPSAPTWIPKASKYTWEGWHRRTITKALGAASKRRCR